VKIIFNRVFIKENATSFLKKSSSPFFLQELRPLTPLKTTNRFTTLTVIGMMKIMCNNQGKPTKADEGSNHIGTQKGKK
jgi:hypothetical protein